MTTADIVILVLVGLAVAGAVAYLIINKIRNKKQGIRSCPGCDACKYARKNND